MNRRTSMWSDTEPAPVFPRLHGDIDTEVAVIGGGVTGITVAALLAGEGVKVALVDMARIAGGESSRTSAQLSVHLDAGYRVIASKFGEAGARLAAESQRQALDTIADLVSAQEIECGFERVSEYIYSEDAGDRGALEQELGALRSAGIRARRATEVPARIRVAAAIELPDQAQLHPRRYLLPLARLVDRSGGAVFERTRCLEIHDGRPCRVVTPDGTVFARRVIVATHVPISTRVALHTKLAPHRTYVVAARVPYPIGALLRDWQPAYHYVRGYRGRAGTYLMAGGEDHHTGDPVEAEDRYRRLEDWTRARFDVEEIEYRWSGQVIEPADGLPLIGRSSGGEHVHVATGFGGNGMTLGTAAALILADAVLGRDNRFTELYRATRVKPLAQARVAIGENVDYAAHLIGDRIDRGEVGDAEDIPRGQGRLMRIGGRMAAVYCDRAGACHYLSAVCPHLGCYVHWNPAEESWDCPCHGSRFEPRGEVINGPSTRDLEPIEPAGQAPALLPGYDS
jgi:glycine/D-amino acid oxidase-like deaminating enzyme/nitrite reductase/ring-hydroxylating ferredoxin subunit